MQHVMNLNILVTDGTNVNLQVMQGGKSVRYIFGGKKVHFLACKETSSGTHTVKIDGSIFAEISTKATEGNKIEEIVFILNDLPYGEHAIEIVNKAGTLVIGGIYYDPLPPEICLILGFDDFRIETGKWTQSQDSTVFSSNSEQATGSFYFYRTEFWLTGARGSNTGNFKIVVDDEESVPINKQNIYDVAQNNKNILFYHYKSESKYHRIKIVRQDQYEVSLVNLFCVIDTPPQTPTEQQPVSNIIIEEKFDDDNRIDRVNFNYQPTFIEVKVSKFTNVEYNFDGGAIHTINSGIKCEGNIFEDCISKQGAGGAIYINYNIDFSNVVSLRELQFWRCKAVFGGVICIISSNQENKVTVASCTFDSCAITGNEEVDSSLNVGGSAIYMQIYTGSFARCKFFNNIGTAVKILNYFDSPNKVSILNQKEDFVSISSCQFDISKQSKSCIFYLCGIQYIFLKGFK